MTTCRPMALHAPRVEAPYTVPPTRSKPLGSDCQSIVAGNKKNFKGEKGKTVRIYLQVALCRPTCQQICRGCIQHLQSPAHTYTVPPWHPIASIRLPSRSSHDRERPNGRKPSSWFSFLFPSPCGVCNLPKGDKSKQGRPAQKRPFPRPRAGPGPLSLHVSAPFPSSPL